MNRKYRFFRPNTPSKNNLVIRVEEATLVPLFMERSTAARTGLCGNDEQNNKQLTKKKKKKAEAQGLVGPDWQAAPEEHEPQLCKKSLETERFWRSTDSTAEGGQKDRGEEREEKKRRGGGRGEEG